MFPEATALVAARQPELLPFTPLYMPLRNRSAYMVFGISQELGLH